MRRDAQLRRDALIAAGAECFAERGYSVPLEDVAARAGVGRGTLYRNFKDRQALAIAIFGKEIDRVAEVVVHEQAFRQSMIDLALIGARGTALFGRIAAELAADTENMAAFEALGGRLAAVLEPLAMRARNAGDLRRDIDGETLGLALRMVGGLTYNVQGETAARYQLNKAIDLILYGMAPQEISTDRYPDILSG